MAIVAVLCLACGAIAGDTKTVLAEQPPIAKLPPPLALPLLPQTEASSADATGTVRATKVMSMLNDLHEQRMQRLDALGKQVETLKRVLEEDRTTGAAEPSALADLPAADAAAGGRADSPGTSDPNPVSRNAQEPTPKVLPSEAPLETDPVDSLALADSLFGAGEIEMALAGYQRLGDGEIPDSDRRWVQYQIASCKRTLGEPGSAEQIYRELLADNRDDMVAAQARWWLETLQTRKRLLGAAQGVQSALEKLKEQIP
jgi:hypothetical protein